MYMQYILIQYILIHTYSAYSHTYIHCSTQYIHTHTDMHIHTLLMHHILHIPYIHTDITYIHYSFKQLNLSISCYHNQIKKCFSCMRECIAIHTHIVHQWYTSSNTYTHTHWIRIMHTVHIYIHTYIHTHMYINTYIHTMRMRTHTPIQCTPTSMALSASFPHLHSPAKWLPSWSLYCC